MVKPKDTRTALAADLVEQYEAEVAALREQRDRLLSALIGLRVAVDEAWGDGAITGEWPAGYIDAEIAADRAIAFARAEPAPAAPHDDVHTAPEEVHPHSEQAVRP